MVTRVTDHSSRTPAAAPGEHPIDMLDEAPEADAAEQWQPATGAASGTGSAAPDGANPADVQEQDDTPAGG
jgi:hypothetical protein